MIFYGVEVIDDLADYSGSACAVVCMWRYQDGITHRERVMSWRGVVWVTVFMMCFAFWIAVFCVLF